MKNEEPETGVWKQGYCGNLSENYKLTDKVKEWEKLCFHCHAIKNKIKNHSVDKVKKL